MLRSVMQMCGDKLGASDGEIGHVKDFYFDDDRWAIRYLVADTGSWIPGRFVLISPHAFGALSPDGKILPVNLTRKQIENSPAIEAHKPLSRKYEEEYYRYYGWPYYWQGEALWGVNGFPIVPQNALPVSDGSPLPVRAASDPADVHLRSVQAVVGYQIETQEGIAGHVTDFMMDDTSWLINHLVVNTGNRFSGKKVFLSPSEVDRISSEESKVFVRSNRQALELGPAYEPPSFPRRSS